MINKIPSVAETRSKSAKILPIGISTKSRKSVITLRKRFEMFENGTYGDFDENVQTFAGRLTKHSFTNCKSKLIGLTKFTLLL